VGSTVDAGGVGRGAGGAEGRVGAGGVSTAIEAAEQMHHDSPFLCYFSHLDIFLPKTSKPWTPHSAGMQLQTTNQAAQVRFHWRPVVTLHLLDLSPTPLLRGCEHSQTATQHAAHMLHMRLASTHTWGSRSPEGWPLHWKTC
jgi:hypothetical protein